MMKQPVRILVVNAALLAAAVLALFPLFWMLSVSFMQPGEASHFPPPLLPAPPANEAGDLRGRRLWPNRGWTFFYLNGAFHAKRTKNRSRTQGYPQAHSRRWHDHHGRPWPKAQPGARHCHAQQEKPRQAPKEGRLIARAASCDPMKIAGRCRRFSWRNTCVTGGP